MGVRYFTSKIEVFTPDDLNSLDLERIAGFITRTRTGSEAGIERNGKQQGYFIGQRHNSRIIEQFTRIGEFYDRIKFLESLILEPTEFSRIERILEHDGYAGKHLPEKIEILCEYNGYFRQGCHDQTKNFYERLMYLKTRDYIDSLLGPAEQALDNAPPHGPADLSRGL